MARGVPGADSEPPPHVSVNPAVMRAVDVSNTTDRIVKITTDSTTAVISSVIPSSSVSILTWGWNNSHSACPDRLEICPDPPRLSA